MSVTVNVGTGEIVYQPDLCGGCGTCEERCPMGVWVLQDSGTRKLASPQNSDMCVVCHVCELRCPNQAIQVLPPLADV